MERHLNTNYIVSKHPSGGIEVGRYSIDHEILLCFSTKLECENVRSQEFKRSSWELTEQAMKFFWFFLQLIRDVFQDVKTVWLIFRIFNYLKKTNPGWGSKGNSTGEGFCLACKLTKLDPWKHIWTTFPAEPRVNPEQCQILEQNVLP